MNRTRFLRSALVVSALALSALVPVGRLSVPAHAADSDYWIVAENQDDGGTAAGSLIAYDPAATDWTQPSAQKWTWTPTTGEGFSATEVKHYTLPTDFKLRTTPAGQRVVVTSSDGLAAIVDPATTSSQNDTWSVDLNGNNLHAAELLPNGDLVVGSSNVIGQTTGGFLRVYASGAGQTNYAAYNLNDVHAVLWDPTFDRLWAIGQIPQSTTYVLDSFAVTGSAAQPHLTLATQTVVSPTVTATHDLNPDPNNPDLLLLGAGTDLWSFNKWTGKVTLLDGLPGAVKSLTEQPSGELVVTQPDSACATAHPGDNWCTDTVDRYTADGSGGYTDSPRTVPGMQFYRARVWNPSYNAIGDTVHGAVTDHALSGGAWTSAAVDTSTAISQTSAAALPDGTLHVQTLVPGSGVYDRTRYADGTWQATPTRIDSNASITAVSSAVVGGTLHVQTVVPGYGVYDRALVSGAWAPSATAVDHNASITQTAAATVGGTLHLETVVPGAGVWDRTLTPGTTESWAGSATSVPGIAGTCTTDATTSCTAQVSATGRADGTLHVQELLPGLGVYDLALSGSTWSQPTLVDANKSITRIAASTLSTTGTGLDQGGVTHLETVVPGYGVWDRTLAPGASSSWAASATQIDTVPSDFTVYGAGTVDRALHVGTAGFPTP